MRRRKKNSPAYTAQILDAVGAPPPSAALDGQCSLAVLYLPPYLALCLCVGAGCAALGRFVTDGDVGWYLLGALVVSLAVSFCGRCARPPYRRIAQSMRWPLVTMFVIFAASVRSSDLLPLQGESAGNAVIAVLVGLVTVVSALLVGARSGGKPVPINAPLVPCLALFGLLCLVSVDSFILVCFLVFVAGALYLLSYERLLRRYDPDEAGPIGVARHVDGTPILPSVETVLRWSASALLVCSIWFGLFMLGGAVLYYPVQSTLPRLLSPQFSRMRAAVQSTVLDFRGSSSIMQLHGGNYVLSDREIMRITELSGEPTGLWRGLVYDRYSKSQWEESDEGETTGRFSEATFSVTAPPNHDDDSVKLTPIDPRLGFYRYVTESIDPLDGGGPTTYASGQITSWHVLPGHEGYVDPVFGIFRPPYIVHSAVIEARPVQLFRVRGLTLAERQALPPDSELAHCLELPDDPDTRRILHNIAVQVALSAPDEAVTPYDRVRAVANYLIENCMYSLKSPQVPPSQDAVVFFLTQSHEGACDMFASSMALLLRDLGVPARIATGYIMPDDTPMYASGAHAKPTFTVREREAHAWVEYYLPGLGWLTYDPTVGTRTSDESITGQLAQLCRLPNINIPVRLLVVPGLGLVLLLVGAGWSMQEKKTREVVALGEEAIRRAAIMAAHQGAIRRLEGFVPLSVTHTPREYEALVSRSRIPLAAKQEFSLLTHLAISARYEETPPAITDAELGAILERFKKELGKKRRF